VKNSSKKHNFFLGFFAPDAYKLQPSYISDQNLQKITLNYFQSGVLTIPDAYKLQPSYISVEKLLPDAKAYITSKFTENYADVWRSVKNSSKKHNFFLGFFAPDAYKLQPSYISDQNLQKITLNYFQSGVLTIVETTKII
jgi:hypothetical protein